MVTGLDEKYSLTVVGGAVLGISSIGFVSIEVGAVSSKDVELQVVVTILDEVVVTG